MKRKYFLILSGLFFGFLALTMRPVPAATADNTIDYEDVVVDIREGGIKDIVFSFQNSNKNPYINRGLQNGFELEELRNKLINKKCKFKFIDYLKPLDFSNKNPTVAYIKTEDGEVLYNVITN